MCAEGEGEGKRGRGGGEREVGGEARFARGVRGGGDQINGPLWQLIDLYAAYLFFHSRRPVIKTVRTHDVDFAS